MDLGKKMEGSGNYHLSTKQVAKKFEFQTKSPIGCSCICSSAAAFRERQKRRGKGIPTGLLLFILVDTLLSSVHTNASPQSHDLFHLCLLSFRLTSPGKWKTRTNCRLRFLHKIGISGIVLQVLGAPLFVVATVLVHLGTEIVRGHGVENGLTMGIKAC